MMKKTIGLLIGLAACAAYAAMPVEKTITHVSTPLQLGHDENHWIFPKEYGVHGLRLNSFFVENRYMYGLDIGFWNASENAGGLQLALYRNQTYHFGGVQLSCWNAETKDVGGLQFAVVSTDAENVYGAQLTGLLGKAAGINGVQIGGISAVSESVTDDIWVVGMQGGIYEALAERLAGVQIGGVFSDVGWDANGIQAAVLFAKARYMKGLQLGGLTARSKETSGVQFAGVIARSEIATAGLLQAAIGLAEAGQMPGGLQVAGVAANVIGQSDGVQLGVISTMAGSLKGLQVAGIWNFVFEDMEGVQLAIGYNHARFVHGVQIGLINQCERLAGVQIGLVNTMKESPARFIPFVRAAF